MVKANSDPHSRRPHGHLWLLTDGTPAHAPPATLAVNADGRVACHLCGAWFEHLGSHLRIHGYTADAYREAVGLTRGRPLCSAAFSTAISARQTASYRNDAAMRERLLTGQERARSGELTRRAVAAAAARREAGREGAQASAHRKAALAEGRATRARRYADERGELLRSRGFSTLGELLRHEYARGASIATLASMTHLGRVGLVQQLRAAGVEIRSAGRNRPRSLLARADRIDASVARRLAIDPAELRSYLVAARAGGSSMADLARESGRSVVWVRARLAGRTTTAVRSARRLDTPSEVAATRGALDRAAG